MAVRRSITTVGFLALGLSVSTLFLPRRLRAKWNLAVPSLCTIQPGRVHNTYSVPSDLDQGECTEIPILQEGDIVLPGFGD